MMIEEDPAWVPAGLIWQDTTPRVEWLRTGDLRFTHPFYRDTLKAAGIVPRRETDIDRVAGLPPVPPAGFIFHLSRCGSTLLTQMLAALPQHIVLSEPPPVDHLLWPPGGLPPESARLAWLRRIVALLSRKRAAEEERTYLKFDSWHTMDLPLIRRAFPEVPRLFIYRDPVEILVSHALSPGSHVIPGVLDPGRTGIPRPAWTEEGLRTYAAMVLARVAGAALEHADAGDRFVHYRELPEALPGILRHFRTDVSAQELQTMLDAAGRYSKDPRRAFTPDTASRQAAATPLIRELAAAHTASLYEALEQARTAQPAL